jgi:outer membrane lipoprotein SlyB
MEILTGTPGPHLDTGVGRTGTPCSRRHGSVECAEEEPMQIHGWCAWLAGVLTVLLLTGCAGQNVSTTGTRVAVTDVGSVAGKWTGLIETSADREEFLELTIDRNGGYRAVATRTIGALDAKGKVAARDGTMVFKGDSGSETTGTLYSQPTPPQRLLLLDGITATGRRFRARLQQQP